MKKLLIISLFFFAGCAYLGFHGKSVRNFPEVHESVVADSECLECHHPDNKNDDAPVSPHPDFTGCLKCHNDEIKK